MEQLPVDPQKTDKLLGGDYPRAAPIMVWVTLLLFLAIVVLLGYRWLKMPEPNGFIQINGTERFAGDEIKITDPTSELSSRAVLTEPDKYSAHFPLPQGTYHVELLKDQQLIWEKTLVLPEAVGMIYTLDPAILPATQPAE